MSQQLVSALVLGAGALMLLFARDRTPRLRLAADLLSLGAISLCLWRGGHNPVLLAGPGADTIWLRGLAIGWWLFACRAAASLVRAFFGHSKRSRETRLFSDLLAGCIYVAWALVVLDLVLKLPIGGLLATSGLVAVVLGFALQNTLADVFAGIAVGVEQPFRVGDRVALGDTVEGTVVQINWRSIRLQTDQEDLAIIPNSVVAKTQIVNRSSPTERGMIRAELPVPASVDPDRMFEVLRWAALLTSDVLQEPAPVALLLRVGERTNFYALVFAIADSRRASRVRSELLRHVRKQLSTSGMGSALSPDCGGRLLREATLFDSLDEARINTLEAALRLRRLAPGDILFAQGLTEPVLYLVAAGVIEVSRSIDGRQEILGRIGAGDYIGEIGLLTGTKRLVTAVAITDARIYALDKAALDPLLADDADLAAAFERSVHRGRDLLQRNPAAAEAEQAVGAGELLARIKKFFSL